MRRTRRALYEALLSLLEDQELASISVRDIVRAADLNRATFYLHYRDKDDFVRQAFDELFEELIGEVRAFVDARSTLSPEAPPDVFVDMFRQMGERPALFLRLLGDGTTDGFGAKFNTFIENETLRHWPDVGGPVPPGQAPIDFRARYVSSATLGTITWWLTNGASEPAETVTGWLWALLRPIWFEHGTTATGDYPNDANPSV